MDHTGITRRAIASGAAMWGISVLSAPSAVAARPARAKPSLQATSGVLLQFGNRGAAVTSVQNRLNALGYWCGTADGVFGESTAQAVLAVQKVSTLARDAIVGPATRRSLEVGRRPGARRGGNRIEVDLARQIVLVVRGGSVRYTFNTSTGNGEMFSYGGRQIKAVTQPGEFKILRHGSTGWDKGELGALWRPYYFNGGIAFHGSLSVPAYPASHGCCRLTIAAQDFLIRQRHLYLGEPVSVY